jgi:hypothetical protein
MRTITTIYVRRRQPDGWLSWLTGGWQTLSDRESNELVRLMCWDEHGQLPTAIEDLKRRGWVEFLDVNDQPRPIEEMDGRLACSPLRNRVIR